MTNYLLASPAEREALGRALRRFRKRMGWTQKDAAQRASLNSETISRLENGARVEPETLMKLCDAYLEEAETPDALDLARHMDELGSSASPGGRSDVGSSSGVLAQLEQKERTAEALLETSRWLAHLGRELRRKADELVDLIGEHLPPDRASGTLAAESDRKGTRPRSAGRGATK